jgi:DNA helicase II / ATP-dependent DNA helicase PcrA
MTLDILNDLQSTILENLNDRQKEAVKSIKGETLVVAGAGSGKTAVLTRRCAYLISSGAAPGSILSLTFTNKAAKEMNERMYKLLYQIGINLPKVPFWSTDYTQAPLFCTFHSLGLRLLREFGQCIEYNKNFSILDRDDQEKMIKEILKDMNIDKDTLSPSAVLYFISLCKQELLTSDKSRQLEQDYLPIFHKVYSAYENKCRNNQAVDFDDLILLPYLILKNNPEVLEICHNRWKHVQIDEFQDINKAQFRLVALLYPEIDLPKN